MEFRITPGPRPSSAEEDEIKLTQILEIERQMVVETQENYKLLKMRFLEVTEQLDLSNKELEILRAEKEAEVNARKELLNLDQKSKEILHQMELDNKQRQLVQHQFQTGTLAELQKVFRKELSDQESDIKRLEQEKEGLVEDNDRLLEEMKQLQSEILKTKKVYREREHELAGNFDRQLQEFMSTLEAEKKNKPEEPLVSSLRERVKLLEGMLESKEKDRRVAMELSEGKMLSLTEQLVVEREKNQRLKTYQSQLEMTKLEAKRIFSEKNKELDELRKQIIELRTQKVKDDTTTAETERRLRNEFFEQSFSIDEKLTSMERAIKERDQYIDELKQRLEEARLEESSLEHLESSCQAEKESRERVERENKRLSDMVERKNSECSQQMAVLKMERNRLEETVCDMKSRLKTTPETIEETLRLRGQLAKKEEKEKELKEHYRVLLSRMKKSLKNIEKRHRHTQRKLEEHILI